jgi:hypothetical protein
MQAEQWATFHYIYAFNPYGSLQAVLFISPLVMGSNLITPVQLKSINQSLSLSLSPQYSARSSSIPPLGGAASVTSQCQEITQGQGLTNHETSITTSVQIHLHQSKVVTGALCKKQALGMADITLKKPLIHGRQIRGLPSSGVTSTYVRNYTNAYHCWSFVLTIR